MLCHHCVFFTGMRDDPQPPTLAADTHHTLLQVVSTYMRIITTATNTHARTTNNAPTHPPAWEEDHQRHRHCQAGRLAF